MNNKIIKRVSTLALILVMALTTLTGCVGAANATVKPVVDTDAFLDLDEACTLSAGELKDIAAMLASVYSTDTKNPFRSTEYLVAAYRGYDMLSEGFDDSKIDPTVVGDPDLEAVVKVIEVANSRADSDTKLLSDTYKQIGEADALTLIRSLQISVELEEKQGVWHTILGWVGVALGWLTQVLGGGYYIIGICIFAIIMEVVLLPFGIKQHKNSIKQAKLRPKEMAIRKKYAGRDDQVTRQKVTQEIQELYQRENYNAASGCLPLLIQMPILIALYNIVVDPLRYVLGQSSAMSAALKLYNTTARAAGGLGTGVASADRGTISLLSQIGRRLDGIKDFMLLRNGEAVYNTMNGLKEEIPNFTLGGINLGEIPSFDQFNELLLVPVLTFVVYFLSMRLTKKFTYQPTNMTAGNDKQAACSSWMMDITMPLMSVYIAFIVPALVGVYWIFKSIISTLRQFIVVKLMPYPTFTEEDYRAAEREFAGKASSKSAPATPHTYAKGTPMVDGKPRSLFHMDDDDYLARVEAEAKKQEEQDKPAASGAVEGAALKQDDRNKKDDK